MITLDYSGIELELKKQEGKTYVHDPIRKKWILLTLEEHVRQYLLQHFITKNEYPKSLIAVEKQIVINNMKKRFDVVIFSKDHTPWMIVECKAPEVVIDELTLNQVMQYHNKLQTKYWLLSNGHQNFCAHVGGTGVEWIDKLPTY